MKISMSEREIAEEYFSCSDAGIEGIDVMNAHHSRVRQVEKQKAFSFWCRLR